MLAHLYLTVIKDRPDGKHAKRRATFSVTFTDETTVDDMIAEAYRFVAHEPGKCRAAIRHTNADLRIYTPQEKCFVSLQPRTAVLSHSAAVCEALALNGAIGLIIDHVSRPAGVPQIAGVGGHHSGNSSAVLSPSSFSPGRHGAVPSHSSDERVDALGLKHFKGLDGSPTNSSDPPQTHLRRGFSSGDMKRVMQDLGADADGARREFPTSPIRGPKDIAAKKKKKRASKEKAPSGNEMAKPRHMESSTDDDRDLLSAPKRTASQVLAAMLKAEEAELDTARAAAGSKHWAERLPNGFPSHEAYEALLTAELDAISEHHSNIQKQTTALDAQRYVVSVTDTTTASASATGDSEPTSISRCEVAEAARDEAASVLCSKRAAMGKSGSREEELVALIAKVTDGGVLSAEEERRAFTDAALSPSAPLIRQREGGDDRPVAYRPSSAAQARDETHRPQEEPSSVAELPTSRWNDVAAFIPPSGEDPRLYAAKVAMSRTASDEAAFAPAPKPQGSDVLQGSKGQEGTTVSSAAPVINDAAAKHHETAEPAHRPPPGFSSFGQRAIVANETTDSRADHRVDHESRSEMPPASHETVVTAAVLPDTSLSRDLQAEVAAILGTSSNAPAPSLPTTIPGTGPGLQLSHALEAELTTRPHQGEVKRRDTMLDDIEAKLLNGTLGGASAQPSIEGPSRTHSSGAAYLVAPVAAQDRDRERLPSPDEGLAGDIRRLPSGVFSNVSSFTDAGAASFAAAAAVQVLGRRKSNTPPNSTPTGLMLSGKEPVVDVKSTGSNPLEDGEIVRVSGHRSSDGLSSGGPISPRVGSDGVLSPSILSAVTPGSVLSPAVAPTDQAGNQAAILMPPALQPLMEEEARAVPRDLTVGHSEPKSGGGDNRTGLECDKRGDSAEGDGSSSGKAVHSAAATPETRPQPQPHLQGSQMSSAQSTVTLGDVSDLGFNPSAVRMPVLRTTRSSLPPRKAGSAVSQTPAAAVRAMDDVTESNVGSQATPQPRPIGWSPQPSVLASMQPDLGRLHPAPLRSPPRDTHHGVQHYPLTHSTPRQQPSEQPADPHRHDVQGAQGSTRLHPSDLFLGSQRGASHNEMRMGGTARRPLDPTPVRAFASEMHRFHDEQQRGFDDGRWHQGHMHLGASSHLQAAPASSAAPVAVGPARVGAAGPRPSSAMTPQQQVQHHHAALMGTRPAPDPSDVIIGSARDTDPRPERSQQQRQQQQQRQSPQWPPPADQPVHGGAARRPPQRSTPGYMAGTFSTRQRTQSLDELPIMATEAAYR